MNPGKRFNLFVSVPSQDTGFYLLVIVISMFVILKFFQGMVRVAVVYHYAERYRCIQLALNVRLRYLIY